MITKQQILDEIRRTARENGGVPLGRLRFEKETGIREYDWLKFWARWGDAQREAGLVPNEKVAGYSDELMIDKFISLMRELGKFPRASLKRFPRLQFSGRKELPTFWIQGGVGRQAA